MRVALISLHFAEYAVRLAAALAERHQVLLILSAPNAISELEGELEEYRNIENLEIILLPHSRSLSTLFGNLYKLISIVSRFNPDLVHAQEVTKDYLVGALLYLSRRFPLVLTVHDPIPHSGEDANSVKGTRHEYYHKLLRRICDQAITHGLAMQRDLESIVPKLAGRVAAIPIGPYGPREFSTQPPEAGVLLFFGRINEYKGLCYFIDAVLALRKAGHLVKGIIAGRGPDLEKFRSTINSNDCFELHERFIPRAEVHTLFLRSQLVVMPYVDATQSGVAALAMGYGRPVIATRVGSIPEMVIDGKTGMLVPPRDVAALVAAIASLLDKPERYAAMLSDLREAVDGPQGWTSIADLTVQEAYRPALNRRT